METETEAEVIDGDKTEEAENNDVEMIAASEHGMYSQRHVCTYTDTYLHGSIMTHYFPFRFGQIRLHVNIPLHLGSPQWSSMVLRHHLLLSSIFISSPTIFVSLFGASIYLFLGLCPGGFMSIICLQGCWLVQVVVF